MGDLLACGLLLAVPLVSFLLFRAARRRHERRASAWSLLAGNAALSLGLVTLALPIGEAYYRFLYDTTDSYQASRVSQRWTARHYRLNDAGVRDDVDYGAAAADDRPRLLVIGDSYTNGHGVADVADRFANRLRSRRPGWAVELIAEDGLDTGAIVERLDRRLATGSRVDVVLYAYCVNDLSDLIRELDGPTRRLYAERPPWLVRHSYLLDVWWWRLRIGLDPELGRYFEHLERAYRDERWELQRGRLARLDEAATGAGARLVVMTWPFFERLEDPAYREIHAALDDSWRTLGVPHDDLSDAFEGEPIDAWIVNPHDTHPNPRAHAVAADAAERLVSSALDAAAAGSGATSSVDTPRTPGIAPD